jgi:PTH2 family peptidyl-tRNA hydrolase
MNESNEIQETIKQIIVIRTKYPDGNGGLKKLRTGKLISQAAHASMAFMSSKLRIPVPGAEDTECRAALLSKEQCHWIDGIFTKICVYVESEEELLHVHKSALEADLTSHLITDKGLTEFGGIPTHTAVAIGPHYESKLKPITGHLPLF